jgi:hypothetical protein
MLRIQEPEVLLLLKVSLAKRLNKSTQDREEFEKEVP